MIGGVVDKRVVQGRNALGHLTVENAGGALVVEGQDLQLASRKLDSIRCDSRRRARRLPGKGLRADRAELDIYYHRGAKVYPKNSTLPDWSSRVLMHCLANHEPAAADSSVIDQCSINMLVVGCCHRGACLEVVRNRMRDTSMQLTALTLKRLGSLISRPQLRVLVEGVYGMAVTGPL